MSIVIYPFFSWFVFWLFVLNSRISTTNSVSMSGSVPLNVSGGPSALLAGDDCKLALGEGTPGVTSASQRRTEAGSRTTPLDAPRPWQDNAPVTNWSKSNELRGMDGVVGLILFATPCQHPPVCIVLLQVPVMDPPPLKLPVRSVAWSISTGFVIVHCHAFW